MNDPVLVIAGGSGFLGQAILKKYGNTPVKIVVLTRKGAVGRGEGARGEAAAEGWRKVEGRGEGAEGWRKAEGRGEGAGRGAGPRYENVSYVQWDATTPGDWMAALEGSLAVINLVGRSVNCRYTERNKNEIIDSRVNATSVLGYAIKVVSRPPKVWINIGSAAIFGDTGEEQRDEDSGVGEGFSAEVCKRWEAAFFNVRTPYTRKVLLRMGLVFQRDVGLLKPFSRLARLGLAGRMGTGQQYISWIHEDDFTGLVTTAIANDDWTGVINGVSPYPVRNEDFLRILRGAYGIRWGLPQPAFMLRMGARLIGTEAELLLTGRRVVSKILAEKEFRFRYPLLEDALGELVVGRLLPAV